MPVSVIFYKSKLDKSFTTRDARDTIPILFLFVGSKNAPLGAVELWRFVAAQRQSMKAKIGINGECYNTSKVERIHTYSILLQYINLSNR